MKKIKPIVFAEDLDQAWKNLITDLVSETEPPRPKKSKKLTGEQWGVLATLVEQNVKEFPAHSYVFDLAENDLDDKANRALNKAIDNCPGLPKHRAKILNGPIEILVNYYEGF